MAKSFQFVIVNIFVFCGFLVLANIGVIVAYQGYQLVKPMFVEHAIFQGALAQF